MSDPIGANEPVSAEAARGVTVMVDEIVRHAGVSIDGDRLGPALLGAQGRTGWTCRALAVYCVEKLKQVRATSPTGLLVADLGRVTAAVVPSPRMGLADALDRLHALWQRLADDKEFDLRGPDNPTTMVWRHLADEGLAVQGSYMPDVWSTKPAHIEGIVDIIEGVIEITGERIAEAQEAAALERRRAEEQADLERRRAESRAQLKAQGIANLFADP